MGVPVSTTVTAHDIHGNDYQIDSNSMQWRPSAYGVVIKDGHVLLLRQNNGHDLPGGGIDLGESCEDAVIREIKEETGMDAANPRLLGAHTSFFKLPHEDDSAEFVHCIMLYYACDLVGGELSTDGFDEWEQVYAEEPEWWPIDKLNELTLATSVDFREYITERAAS